LGGWELAVIATAASGNSHTVYQNGISENGNLVDTEAYGPLNGLQALIGSGYNEPHRPLVTGQPCDAGRNGNLLYNPAAFTLIGYQLGTLPSNLEPRGYCPGPHLVNTDFSIDKNWKLSERFSMKFALDFFNLFNHSNFRGDVVQGYTPSQNVNCGPADINQMYAPCSPTNNIVTAETPTGAFGRSNETTNKAGRELQYSLRITF
jgi:hypothetical protein